MIEFMVHPHVQIPNIEDGKTAAISVGSLGYSFRRQGGTKGWTVGVRYPVAELPESRRTKSRWGLGVGSETAGRWRF
jgi:hypothetical protein